jgi:hypothetical protein
VQALNRAGTAAAKPGKPVRLLPRPAFLAGRQELLADLNARPTSGNGPGPQVVALSGLGGVGKTSVAVEYAHRHLSEMGLAWQLPAEDTIALAAGFTDLAGQLGIGRAASSGDSVAAVHSMLAAYPAPWLLIFDNVPSPDQVQEFLPPAGNGQLLITSRNARWPPNQAIEVPALDRDVAARFLVERTHDANDQAARALAGELDGLPLALEQAAGHIQASRCSLARYLVLFRRCRSDMPARDGSAGCPETVATTWELTVANLEQSAHAAAGLLRLLAYFAPEAIPLRRLLQSRPELTDGLAPVVAEVLVPLLEGERAARDAVAALRQYSLVRPAGDEAVSVHRLVQLATTSQMPADLAQASRRAAAAVIEAAIPEDPQQPADWPAFAALLPHVRAVLDLTSDGTRQIASYLGHSGNYPAVRDLLRQIADAYSEDDAHGPEHRDTLATRRELAYWTGQAGDAAGARDQYAALLPIRQRVLGREHPDTLATCHGLAHWTGEAGDAAGARDQFAGLLALRQRVLGPEHPDMLVARYELATWTGEAGDAAGARDQYAALLPVEERVSGPEHPDTLAARYGLAYWTGEAGDAAGACDQFAGLLPIRQRVLGPEHPGTLAARHNLAYWTGEAGDAAGARDQFAGLLPIRQRVLGPEHPDTQAARNQHARWIGEAGDAAGARDQFAALLPVEERVSGPEHPTTLTTRGNLAAWTGEAGDAAGARDQFAALLPVEERVSGPEHPDTRAARHNLAHWTGEAGDAAGARDQFAALLPVEGRVSGPEHPDTLITRHELAHWTGEAGDAAGARDQYAALLTVEERVSGPEQPSTLTTRGNLAAWTGEAGDAAGACDQYAALLLIRERVSGPEHPDTLTARGNLSYWDPEGGAWRYARGGLATPTFICAMHPHLSVGGQSVAVSLNADQRLQCLHDICQLLGHSERGVNLRDQQGRPGVLNASRWLPPPDTISPRLRRPTIPERSRASDSHPDANPSASAARHEPNPGSRRSRTSPTAGDRRNPHADARRPRPIALRHLLAPHTDVEAAPTSPADCGTGSGA